MVPPRTLLLRAGIAAVIVLLCLVACRAAGRPLYPILPSPTVAPRTGVEGPTLVNFAELNNNPAALRGQSIQVTGSYTPLEVPRCLGYNGPLIQWSLVSDNLQLNARGFENILRLAEPGITMTVSGIWRLYEGPVGCGKAPPAGNIWYIDVRQIIEPNPLLGSLHGDVTFVPGPGRPTLEVPILPTSEVAPPTAEMTTTPEPEATPSPQTPESPVVTPSPTETPTPLGHTPLPGGSSTATSEVVTPGPGTPSLTPTATADGTATATPEGGGLVTPDLPTLTPGATGYPQGTATATVDPYP